MNDLPPPKDEWGELIAKAETREQLRQIIGLSNSVRPSGSERRRRLSLAHARAALLPRPQPSIWAEPKKAKPKAPRRSSKGAVVMPKFHRKRWADFMYWVNYRAQQLQPLKGLL